MLPSQCKKPWANWGLPKPTTRLREGKPPSACKPHWASACELPDRTTWPRLEKVPSTCNSLWDKGRGPALPKRIPQSLLKQRKRPAESCCGLPRRTSSRLGLPPSKHKWPAKVSFGALSLQLALAAPMSQVLQSNWPTGELCAPPLLAASGDAPQQSICPIGEHGDIGNSAFGAPACRVLARSSRLSAAHSAVHAGERGSHGEFPSRGDKAPESLEMRRPDSEPKEGEVPDRAVAAPVGVTSSSIGLSPDSLLRHEAIEEDADVVDDGTWVEAGLPSSTSAPSSAPKRSKLRPKRAGRSACAQGKRSPPPGLLIIVATFFSAEPSSTRAETGADQSRLRSCFKDECGNKLDLGRHEDTQADAMRFVTRTKLGQ
mmetsp:Transcript_22851/g.64220  ORF Transcript_22851/g.64220 Transcript_22851/m.64220 type:complete len:373 (+) Transcript_22851:321-1439(+)